jgi:uncharacterized protein (DUF697 family)
LMKSIATGIAANIVSIIPGILLAKIGGAVAKLFPGVGTAGGMLIDASVNYAIMVVMGIVYLKALTYVFERKGPLTEQSLRTASKEATSDKGFIRETFDEAKKSYKPRPDGDAPSSS